MRRPFSGQAGKEPLPVEITVGRSKRIAKINFFEGSRTLRNIIRDCDEFREDLLGPITMKIYSLCENHLFLKAYNSEKKLVKKRIVLYILADKNASLIKKRNPLKEKLNRVGITASKKIGGAVERSRAKRVIREAYRRLEREQTVKKGLIVVIAARHALLSSKMDEVYAELLDASVKLGLVLCQSNAEIIAESEKSTEE